MKMHTRAAVNKAIMYTVLVVMAFIMLVPFAWMILTALKTNQEAISVDPFYIFPRQRLAVGQLCQGLGKLQFCGAVQEHSADDPLPGHLRLSDCHHGRLCLRPPAFPR